MNATSATLVDLLAAAEAAAPVRDWRVAGVRVWTLLRVRWFFAIWSEQYCAPGERSGRVTRLVRHLGGLALGRIRCWLARMRDRSAELNLDAARDVVFLSDGVSFVCVDGRWYDRFCDPLIELLQARGLSSAMLTAAHRYLVPRHTPSHFVQPRVDVANVRGNAHGRNFGASAQLPGLETVRRVLAGVGVDHPSLARTKIAADSGRVRAVARAYGSLLDRLRPRLAFIVSYYSLDGMAFALACRERGIPLVDIQHGVQGALHPAYGRLPPAPSEGYELVPDRFWVWSDEEAAAVAQWAGTGSRHAAVTGGNVWLDRWLRGEGALVRDADARVRELRARSGANPVVLVTLQWGLTDAEQWGPLAELMRLSAGRCTFWLRLHPVMLEQRATIAARVAALGVPGAIVDAPTDLPLYALLRHADVHLTHSSSTVIEAELFGVRSVVMSDYGAEIYPRQITSGVARLIARDAAALLGALQAQAALRGPVASVGDRAGPSLDRLLAEAGLRAGRAP